MSETGGPSPDEIFKDLSKAREGDPAVKQAGQEALKSFEGAQSKPENAGDTNMGAERIPSQQDKDINAARVGEKTIFKEVPRDSDIFQNPNSGLLEVNLSPDIETDEISPKVETFGLKPLDTAKREASPKPREVLSFPGGEHRSGPPIDKNKITPDELQRLLQIVQDPESPAGFKDIAKSALIRAGIMGTSAEKTVAPWPTPEEVLPQERIEQNVSEQEQPVDIFAQPPEGFTELTPTEKINEQSDKRSQSVEDNADIKGITVDAKDNEDGTKQIVIKGDALKTLDEGALVRVIEKASGKFLRPADEVKANVIFGNPVDVTRRILREVVENSVGAGATEVRINVDQANGLTLRIDDNGPGFKPEQLGKEQGSVIKTTKPEVTQMGGAGVGSLYVDSQIDTNFGGTVSRSNRPEGGASVSIHLPNSPSVDQMIIGNAGRSLPRTDVPRSSPEDFLREQLDKALPGTVTKSEKMDVNGTPVTKETVIGPDGKAYERLVVASPLVVDLQKGLRPEDFSRLGGSLSAVQQLVDREVKKINLNPDTAVKQENGTRVVWRVPQPDGTSVDVHVQVAGLPTTKVATGSIHGASPNISVPVDGGQINVQRTLRKGPNPIGVDNPDPRLGLTKTAQEALRTEGDKVTIAPAQGRLEVNGKVVDANRPVVLKTQDSALVTVVTKGPDGKPQTTLVRLVPRAADPGMNSSRYAGDVEVAQKSVDADLKYLVTGALSQATNGVLPPDIGNSLKKQITEQIRAEQEMDELIDAIRGDAYTPDLSGSGRATMDPRTGQMVGGRSEAGSSPLPDITRVPNIRPLTERAVTRGSTAQNPKLAEAFQPEAFRQPDPNAGKGVLSRAAGFLGGVVSALAGGGSKPEGANDQRPEPQRRATERPQEPIGEVQRQTADTKLNPYVGLGITPELAREYLRQGIGPNEALERELSQIKAQQEAQNQKGLQAGAEREERSKTAQRQAEAALAGREAALERGRADATRRESQNQRGGNVDEGRSAPQRQEAPERPAQAPLPDSGQQQNEPKKGLFDRFFGAGSRTQNNTSGSDTEASGSQPWEGLAQQDVPETRPQEPRQRATGTTTTGLEDFTPQGPDQREIDARNRELEKLINGGNENNDTEEKKNDPQKVGTALPETPTGQAERDTRAAAYSPEMRDKPKEEREEYIKTLEKMRTGEDLSLADQVRAEQLRQMGRVMNTSDADSLPEYPPVSGRMQNPVTPPSSGGGGLFDDILDKD